MFDWFNCFLWVGSLLCFITYITERYTNTEEVLSDDVSHQVPFVWFHLCHLIPFKLYLGCALAGAVLISGSFSYYQEAKSANIFIAFQDLIPRTVTVIRGGSKLTCPTTELVIGDLIEINAGDRVPADIRIIDSLGIKCVNPLMTGNCEPFMRTNECTHLNIFETNNLVFFSTNCVEGLGQTIYLKHLSILMLFRVS